MKIRDVMTSHEIAELSGRCSVTLIVTLSCVLFNSMNIFSR